MRARTPIPRLVAAVTLSIVMVSVGGCQTIDRSSVVNTLAAWIAESGKRTYTAEYRLASGANATVSQAQKPLRSALSAPDERRIVTEEATTACVGTTCTLTAPPVPNNKPAVAIFDQTSPKEAMRRLTAASLTDTATIESSASTIAGQKATCVRVDDGTQFEICVTESGVLSRFTAAGGVTDAKIELTGYREAVNEEAFAPPGGSTIIDRRPGQG
jgi:hypothetical protein